MGKSNIDYYFIGDKKSLQQFCDDLRRVTEAPKKTGASYKCIPCNLHTDIPDYTIWFNWGPDSRDIRKFDTCSDKWLLSLSSDHCGKAYNNYLYTFSELLKYYPDIDFYFCVFSPEGIFSNDIDGKIIMPSKDIHYKSINK